MFEVFTFGLTGIVMGTGICTGIGIGIAYTVVTVVVFAGEYDTTLGGGGELTVT